MSTVESGSLLEPHSYCSCYLCILPSQLHAISSKPAVHVQAYWPFHKTACNRNEFADSVEDVEPKFASWMRSHGKLAVLKDDEIERLERANAACAGLDRAEVMDSMYNRLDPKPKGITLAACTRMPHQRPLA